MGDTITVPVAPPLSRLPRVELMHAGQWGISTGTANFTTDDLAGAVAALDCPAVRRPILKLGHTDPRFDGEPAVGWVANMATADEGRTLVGDYVGMPGWLGKINPDGGSVIASAYPDRSIEGEWDFLCQIGHVHPFVVTAVALLGVRPPGIGTLNSLQDVGTLYGVTASTEPPAGGIPFRVVVRAAAMEHTGAMVALVPTEQDAERLAVLDGEPADALHVTLVYLGDAADYDDDQQTQIIDAIRSIAAEVEPITADGFAVSLFNPDSPDRPTCIALGLSGTELDTVHTLVTDTIDGLDLPDVPEQHSPWTAHLTLVYTDDAEQVAELADRTGPLAFDRLRISFAGAVTDVSLGAAVAASARKDRTMPNPSPREVAAGVTSDDVRRQYYESAGWSYWITEMQLDPLQLIVTDDNTGKTFRVPVTINGDEFTFGDVIEVTVEYVDKPATTAAASTRLVYASRAESRPGKKPAAATGPTGTPPTEPPAVPPVPPAAEPEPTTTQTEEDDMSTLSDIRSRLGLATDADDAAVLAAIDDVMDKATEPTPTPAPVAAAKLPDGVVAVDKTVLDELRSKAEAGVEARAQQRAEARDRVLDDAVRAGKIPPARREHWLTAYDADPEGTTQTLASLAPGLVPVATVGYQGADPESSDDDAMFAGMFPPASDDKTKAA